MGPTVYELVKRGVFADRLTQMCPRITEITITDVSKEGKDKEGMIIDIWFACSPAQQQFTNKDFLFQATFNPLTWESQEYYTLAGTLMRDFMQCDADLNREIQESYFARVEELENIRAESELGVASHAGGGNGHQT